MNNYLARSIFVFPLIGSTLALTTVDAARSQAFPQWITIEGDNGSSLQYDYNSLKSLPNGVKQIDTYQPSIKSSSLTYISCSKWKFSFAGDRLWNIMPPDSKIEALAFKVCGKTKGALAAKQPGAKGEDKALIYYNLGVTKYKKGDVLGAIFEYNRAIAVNPRHAEAYYNRGYAKDDIGDKQGALIDYTQSITVNPRYAPAYNNRGMLRSALGDKQGAINDYSQAIALRPQYALYHYNLGAIKLELGDYEGSIADNTRAIVINPLDADAYRNRGIAYEELTDLYRACFDWRKAASLGIADVTGWIKKQCN